ncbi:MAG: 3-phosphoserine/phosphohydroxythreonine transaminase [Acidobacteriota bacterium]
MSHETPRVFNFAAGPAVLPLPVLEEAQRDLVSMPGAGMSILEMSHRGKFFDACAKQTEADIRKLADIPDDYRVLFLPGGASLQFSMVPLNFLPRDGSANYIVTGSWSQKAVKEAKKVAGVNVAWTGEAGNFSTVPAPGDLKLNPNAAYVAFTSNETIHGVEFKYVPDSGGVPLVCDTSSDMFSRPLDVTKHALIYAGAQKNIGPAGVALVIVRDEWLKRRVDDPKLPTMLNYAIHAENGSMYNTPPVFAIYIMGLVMKWLLAIGGLPAIHAINERKAARLYAEIDRTGFYRGHAEKACRSLMNVTFRLPSEELEAAFVKESKAAGLDGLKGHRSVGGLRASIYNAFPEDGIDALVQFMREFERKNG